MPKVAQPASGRAFGLQRFSGWLFGTKWGWVVHNKQYILHSGTRISLNSLTWLPDYALGDAITIFMIEVREIREGQ